MEVEATKKEVVIGTILLMSLFAALAYVSSEVLRFILYTGYTIYKSI